MVENHRDCVLQWAGHAGYITERFSGLLARQALVDVMLICEEQKLRVHKLVLASNSMYFEEILQQDLGQEPIIFLRDLNFEILKAMVEFMYCGQTTISHQNLPSLLTAAKIFKVKGLAYAIDTLMDPDKSNESCKNDTELHTDKYGFKVINETFDESDNMQIKYAKLGTDECSLLCADSNNVNLNENHSLENNVTNNTEHEVQCALYETSQIIEEEKKIVNTAITTADNVIKEQDKSYTIPVYCKITDTSQKYAQDNVINDNVFSKDQESKPILYEQCCDFADIDDSEQVTVPQTQSCLQKVDKDFSQHSLDAVDVPNKMTKCVKVYTHKRRKSVDEVRTKLVHMNNSLPNPPSTDCIDLLDEPSCNDIPVSLLTSLDMESAEYILSLSTENIQSIVGGTINDQLGFIRYKDGTKQCNRKTYNGLVASGQKENIRKKDLNSVDKNSTDNVKPILRRSLRLNQHENEEFIYNNNLPIKTTLQTDKQFKKTICANQTELYTKSKRKTRDIDHKILDQTLDHTMQSSKKNYYNSRNSRNTTKLIVKKNTRATCPASGKEKEDHKSKSNNKFKCESNLSSRKINDIPDITTVATIRPNNISHINRALWGDMSDIVDSNEYSFDLLEHTSNTEIPFAVGLLPLRTALERMQATPDYQPRKTRSSVAPIKQDLYSLKRKNIAVLDNSTNVKKQNVDTGSLNENANTVCHIKISTAPSQYVRNRKKFLSDHISTLESTTVLSRR